MKIHVIKKADKKANPHAGCAFMIEQMPEPRK